MLPHSFARRTMASRSGVLTPTYEMGAHEEATFGRGARHCRRHHCDRSCLAGRRDQSRELLERKVQVAATDNCLHGAGVTASTEMPSDLAAFVAGEARDRIVRSSFFGFFDTESYQRYGYQRPPGVPNSLAVKSPDVSSLESCSKKGHAAVGNLELTTEATVLPNGGPVLPLADSRYQQAVGAWRKCMTAHGYDYSDPRAPLSDPQWRDHPIVSPVPPSAEIATAIADVQCKVSTNLVGIAVAVQSAYDQLYINSHASQLTAFRDQVQGYLRNATK
jgi:hypothetical protein